MGRDMRTVAPLLPVPDSRKTSLGANIQGYTHTGVIKLDSAASNAIGQFDFRWTIWAISIQQKLPKMPNSLKKS